MLAALTAVSCHSRKDRVVAQVYQYKLYNSELQNIMPSGLSPEDSMVLVNDYVENWIKEKLILHEAEKKLTPFEKNFEREISNYRDILLINKYYEKLWKSDTSNLKITDKDVSDFSKSLDTRYTVEKEIVRVNYVKMPSNSSDLPRVREILFNENLRRENKQELSDMLGDTIEYLLDDDAWLYLDDLQNEVAFEISVGENGAKPKCIEKRVGDNVIFIVILDYRSQRSVNETSEERAAAEMLLLNQRRSQFINDYVEKLYEKALKEGKIVQ